MYKSILITTKIACLFFFVVFTFGCDSQTEPPQAPKVITQKIDVSKTAQPAPPKPPAQQPPAPIQPPGSTQQKLPAKPEAPSKITQPVPVAEKPIPAPEKKITEAKKTAETGEQDSGAETSETDLKKLIADVAGGYSPAGKVDPFLPLFEEKPAAPEETEGAEKPKKKRRIPLTPLERVDLSQLKLVGIIQAPSGNKALVEEASGKGYIIKKGTFIGIHAGRVLEIQKDRVVVEEEVENVLGQFTLERKELKLQKPPGEF
jgi:Tfp pilus assembly protein PilP